MKVERDEILEVLFENYIDTQLKVIMKERWMGLDYGTKTLN